MEGLGPQLSQRLTLLQADLTDKESIMNACQGAHFVVHTASPVPSPDREPTEKEMVEPAMFGTQAVLDGCIAHNVKRLVMTSSMAAIVSNSDTNQFTFDEETWSDADCCDPYSKSKLLSEKLVWDFV
jgi:nucleoside-diphosphate-sugar epimerase